MNASISTNQLNPAFGLAAGGAEGAAASAPAVRSVTALLIASVFWTLLGTAVYFGLYALLAPELEPEQTLEYACLAGGAGIFVATLHLRGLKGYWIFLSALLGAYLLRVLVGVVLYLSLNPGYFEGQGRYHNSNWEFCWTYDSAVTAADSVAKKGEWRTSRIFPTNEDKNAYLHTWMGYYLAAGESRHALDFTPFNAFHHVVAGSLVVGLALACGYRRRTALLSGMVTAWIPWAFAGSIMWRDSVGLAWIVLALVLVCIGRQLGMIASVLLAVPAAFLAWADRFPYLLAIVAITVISMVWDQQKNSDGWTRFARVLLLALAIPVAVYALGHELQSLALVHHGQQAGGIASRVIMLPLMVLRALAGPFPWFVGNKFDWYVVCDYLFHVLQFAVFLAFVVHWRVIVKRANLLTYSAAIFWAIGCLASGVHTAYLAVAFPFILAPVLETGARMWRYLALSAFLFMAANLGYVALGLAGSGLVLGTTGY